jgi:hypothetical protein
MTASDPPSRSRNAKLDAERARMGEERLAAEHDTTRAVRGEFFRAALLCIASCLGGLVLMGYGLHTSDHQTGMIFWWGGLAVGYTGITLTLASAYRRGEERGYW